MEGQLVGILMTYWPPIPATICLTGGTLKTYAHTLNRRNIIHNGLNINIITYMVGAEGVEPSRLAAQEPKSCVYANFTTRPKGEIRRNTP